MDEYELPKYGRAVRENILKRDNECQGCGIFEGCDRREPERIPARLEVHHILPRGYAKRLDFNPNFPENLITLCKPSHRGDVSSVHPDIYRAGIEYNRGDKDAFTKAKAHHERLLDNQRIYWNGEHDRQLSAQAVRQTQKRRREGWRWITDD